VPHHLVMDNRLGHAREKEIAEAPGNTLVGASAIGLAALRIPPITLAVRAGAPAVARRSAGVAGIHVVRQGLLRRALVVRQVRCPAAAARMK